MEYQNGRIYKVTNNVNEMVYIGSTTKQLWIRMRASIFNEPSKKTALCFIQIIS